MPRQPKSAADCKLTVEHWERKVTLLKRQLQDAEESLRLERRELERAETRERKIESSRRPPAC